MLYHRTPPSGSPPPRPWLRLPTLVPGLLLILLLLGAGIPLRAAHGDEGLLSRAEELVRAGQPRQAARLLEAQLPTLPPERRPAALVQLGSAHTFAGYLRSAERVLREALELTGERGAVAAGAWLNLGNLLSQRERFAEAADAYARAAREGTAAGLTTLTLKARLNDARLEERRGRTRQALSALAPLDRAIHSLPPGEERTELLLAQGRLWHRLFARQPARRAWLQRAEDLYRQAAGESAGSSQPRLASQAAGLQGELRLLAGDPTRALELAQEAEFIAQQGAAPELLYRWQLLTGRILLEQGERSQALEAWRRAVFNLDRVRAGLVTGEGEGSAFQEAVGPVFLEFVDLLLQEVATLPASHPRRQPWLQEARQTLESLKVAELEDYFQDECVANARTDAADPTLSQPGVLVLYPVLLPDRVELLAEVAGTIHLVTLPIPAPQLTEGVRQFRQLLEKRTTRQYLRPARALYDQLVRPLEPLLEEKGIHTLVLVPDGPLRTIPFAALHDGRQHLVERLAVAVTPSLSLTTLHSGAGRDRAILLGGLTQGVQGFPPLPFVEHELDQVAGLFSHQRLQDREFSRGNLNQALERRSYPLVHLATHAQFEEEVERSFVLTHHERLTLDQLDQLVRQVDQQGDGVEMLTLSACQTAMGNDRAALGLAGIAVKAGAKSALATLWYVNDEASARLVGSFYEHLAGEPDSKARALRQAQLELLGDRRYRHPGYWSPFLLIGNWM